MAMPEETVLHVATSKSHSLRTTVPIGIARQFKLEVGDKLSWDIRAKNNELMIVVTPKKRVRK